MKQTLKLTALIILVLGGMLAVWANKMSIAAKVETIESVATAERVESANPLYISNCARCHGADGKGNTKLGEEMGVPDLTITARRMSLTRVKNIISNGLGDMPAYKKKLKAAQITSLANYVRKLR
jgi:mono/diheme cytochrome c family protein